MSQSDKSNNKKSKAVALKYQAETDVAPIVIASGCGNVAEKIIDIAENKGIPVFRDDSAASLMCMLEVGRPIPPELYQIVAVIYGHLLKVSKDIKHYADQAPVVKAKTTPARARRHSHRRNHSR